MSAIELLDLTKCFGPRSVIDGLCLTVESGSIYGLLGPNGSGKTTTLACALGLLRPTSGSARVLGEPAGSLHRLQGRLSAVFDTAIALPGLTATQNLDYIRTLLGHSRGRGNAEVLDAVELADYAGAKVRSLSFGQAKRLAIAGALLGEPELLVLDEPLSGLDTMGVRNMLGLFRRLRDEGLTLLLSSHRLIEMQSVVTHAGILHGGRIVKGGTLTKVLGNDDLVYSFIIDRPVEATEIVQGADGFEWLGREDLPGGRARIAVRVGDPGVGVLNRTLVERGIEVSGIESRTQTLQSVFEEIVDPREAQGVVA